MHQDNTAGNEQNLKVEIFSHVSEEKATSQHIQFEDDIHSKRQRRIENSILL